MSYEPGIYIRTELSFGSPITVNNWLSEMRHLSKKVRFARICRRFVDLLIRVYLHSLGALPPVRWFTEQGEELPRELGPLMDEIMSRRIPGLVLQNYSYRNGYTGREIDCRLFLEYRDKMQRDSWQGQAWVEAICRAVARRAVRETLQKQHPRKRPLVKDSLRPLPG